MEWVLERIMDAFNHHPMFFMYLVISITGLIVLSLDLYRFKSNQVSRQVSSRIGKEEEKEEKLDIIDYVSKFFENKEEEIKINLEKANVMFSPREYLTFLTIGSAIGILLGLTIFPLSTLFKGIFLWLPFSVAQEIFGRLLAAVAFGFIGTFTPRAWLFYLTFKRVKLIEEQMIDAFLNIADALKSGHVPQDAIKIVGEESAYPIGHEFSRAYREMEAGKTLEQSLGALKQRVEIRDFQMAINAIEIQYEVGGKLEPLLRNMVKIIGDRKELKKEIEKTISQSKTVGIVLLSAPIFFAVVFSMINKEQFFTMFENFIGQILIGIAILCYIVAAALIVWIIRDVSKDI